MIYDPFWISGTFIFLWVVVPLGVLDIAYAGRLFLTIGTKCKCSYKALGKASFLFALWMFLFVRPRYFVQGSYANKFLICALVLWLFGVLCAILQYRVCKKKPWRIILWDVFRNTMDKIAKWVKRDKRITASLTDKEIYRFKGKLSGCAIKLQQFAYLLFVIILVGFYFLCPKGLLWVGLALCPFYLYLTVGRAQYSCRALFSFWFKPCLIVAFYVYALTSGWVPSSALAPVAYTIGCIVLTLCWCWSAALADPKVAKVAGTTINTLTTIFLVAINILVSWLTENVASPSKFAWADLIYVGNLALFPIIAAGYLSILFVDLLKYFDEKEALVSSQL